MSGNKMDIFTEIKAILREILDVEDRAITPESYLIRELGVESIDLLELASAVSARFKIEVEEADIFLQGIGLQGIGLQGVGLQGVGGELKAGEIPFLTVERLGEIVADIPGGPVIKVKDLVSYVAWQLGKTVKFP